MTAVPSRETPRSVSYVRPSSRRTVMRGSRRRLTAFCDRPFVSNQICPSITPYHMATRWGTPVGPTVAMVALRCASMNAATSSSVMVICDRWLVPTFVPSGCSAPGPARRPDPTSGAGGGRRPRRRHDVLAVDPMDEGPLGQALLRIEQVAVVDPAEPGLLECPPRRPVPRIDVDHDGSTAGVPLERGRQERRDHRRTDAPSDEVGLADQVVDAGHAGRVDGDSQRGSPLGFVVDAVALDHADGPSI